MSGKSLITTAALLIVVAGVFVFGDERKPSVVEIETKKVVVADSSRPPMDATKPNGSMNRPARVLFITAKGCEQCEKELNRLNKPGGEFEVMRLRGWKIGETENNHVQIVDRDEIPLLVELLKVREYPTVACIENGQIVRSFKDGCTTPLDSWTFGWLLKRAERTATIFDSRSKSSCHDRKLPIARQSLDFGGRSESIEAVRFEPSSRPEPRPCSPGVWGDRDLVL